jgi:phosphatidylserine/phosphatidylglycerophosphate/cardiolipin synthase-like enzyme
LALVHAWDCARPYRPGIVAAMTGLVERADDAVGQAIERLVMAHHRRRLRRAGQLPALDAQRAGWIRGELPPRAGNQVEVLVDGAVALPEIADAIAGASRSVHLAGWHVRPGFTLVRHGTPVVLRDLLAEAAERIDVRVLLWAGAPIPLFHPTRAEARRSGDELVAGTRIRCGLDRRERPMHCHHEKLVIVDGRVAFVGGIDITDLGGDRFDHVGHPPRPPIGWHDVCMRLRGPVVADVERHFGMRWHETTGEALPAPALPEHAGSTAAQVVRTVPQGVYRALPAGDYGIAAVYLGALRGAQRFVYLESQFLWSPEVVAVLAAKLRTPPGDDFRVMVLLPAHPFNGSDDTRGQLGVLSDADAGRGRFLACTISGFAGGSVAPVYVHAKVGIVDDRWMTIGSANLNEHSLFNDTEVNLVTDDASLAETTRQRLWAEHLHMDAADLPRDPVLAIDTLLRPVAEEQLRRVRAGLPRTAPLLQLTSSSHRIERLLGPVQGLVVDG